MGEVRFSSIGTDGICVVTLQTVLTPSYAFPHLVVEVVPAVVGRVAWISIF